MDIFSSYLSLHPTENSKSQPNPKRVTALLRKGGYDCVPGKVAPVRLLPFPELEKYEYLQK